MGCCQTHRGGEPRSSLFLSVNGETYISPVTALRLRMRIRKGDGHAGVQAMTDSYSSPGCGIRLVRLRPVPIGKLCGRWTDTARLSVLVNSQKLNRLRLSLRHTQSDWSTAFWVRNAIKFEETWGTLGTYEIILYGSCSHAGRGKWNPWPLGLTKVRRVELGVEPSNDIR